MSAFEFSSLQFSFCTVKHYFKTGNDHEFLSFSFLFFLKVISLCSSQKQQSSSFHTVTEILNGREFSMVSGAV